MKKITVILIAILFAGVLNAQTDSIDIKLDTNRNKGFELIGEPDAYVNGMFGVGTQNFQQIHSTSPYFTNKTPKMEIITGNSPNTPYEEFVTIRHLWSDEAHRTRRLGLLLKLNSESSSNETAKMGGVMLESDREWSNYPSLHLLTNNEKRLTILSNGYVGIGETEPQSLLAVKGKISALEVEVLSAANWPDFVFKENYQLKPLNELKSFINENNHLPDIPSEDEIKDGYDITEMDANLLRKIEELTLYVIEQKEEIDNLKQKIETLESK